MSIEIITYGDEHFDGVSSLWREAFPADPPWNNAATVLPTKLAFQPNLVIVALDRGPVIGSILAGYDGHRGWINRIAVRNSHRRQHVGTALMREAEARLQAIGCIKVNLQVRSSNAAVVEFYRRLGYSIEERVSMAKPLGAFASA
jgi:ribosomal protein S18 acetylase RimI-like enzyme